MLINSAPLQTEQQLETGTTALLLAIAFGILTISLFTPVLTWITILAMCATCVRVYVFWRRPTQTLTMRTINLLAVLAALALAWFSLSIGLLLTMVNLLVMACAFKLLKINRRKDLGQLFASLLFLTGCGFIFQQGIAFTAIYIVVIVILLTSLLTLNAPSLKRHDIIRYVSVQLVQALPIAILLFLVLPQLPPLWQMPTAKSAKTGLSDKVTPGDIAELSQSAELAFRATFEDAQPYATQRYWRAMTLEHFDGKTWSISSTRQQVNRQYRSLNREFTPSVSGPSWRYQVITEPSHQRWLFSLDVPKAESTTDVLVRHGHEYQLYASRPIVSPMRYDVESYYQTPMDQTLQSIDHRINLQIPLEGNPLTQQWVEKLRRENPSDDAFISAVKAYFDSLPFRYTLRPPKMPTDPVDAFLFEHQAGFCVHYASAFAYALRLAGIPSRLVTGYQGGEQQSQNVVSVYQYDAHAWVEVWSDERGWRRYDPTAWVAPDRIEYGLEQALREEGSFLSDSPLALARFKNIALFNQLRLWFANLDYQWSKWILSFDRQQQEDFLQRLFGDLSATKLSMIGLGLVGAIALLLFLYVLPLLRNRPRDPMAHEYRLAAALVESSTGLSRNTLAPNEYLHVTKPLLNPAGYKLFNDITDMFLSAAYRPTNDTQQHSQLRALRRRLKRQIQKSR